MSLNQTKTRQRGFFSIGIGIALAAIFAGTTAGIVAIESDDDEIVFEQTADTYAVVETTSNSH
jgi:hypothetical protein